MSTDPVVIVSYARTPMGSFQGALAGASATELGAAAVKAAVDRAGASADAIERIYMGCVLPAGLGQAPARQAAIGAGLGTHVEATTVNKMCGSGMQAAIMAADALAAGSVDLLVAGGMESMTNAPYLSRKHRGGARIGHDTFYDHMYLDGLEDAYEPGKLMGNFAEDTAADYQFTRKAMDDYAIESLHRAQRAQGSGAFDREIVPVEVKGRKGSTTVALDEQPAKGDVAKIPTLKPAFSREGTITAANASSISDGAAALVMTRASVAERLGLTPIARVVGRLSACGAPQQLRARRRTFVHLDRLRAADDRRPSLAQQRGEHPALRAVGVLHLAPLLERRDDTHRQVGTLVQPACRIGLVGAGAHPRATGVDRRIIGQRLLRLGGQRTAVGRQHRQSRDR
jgi:acetyl-CoA C-acetyltransferase